MRCDIFEKAATLILKGFVKGTRHEDRWEDGARVGHRMCMLGALETANTGKEMWHSFSDSAEIHPNTAPLIPFLADLLPNPHGYRYDLKGDIGNACSIIAQWNNMEERTAEEVASKFSEAAALCRTKVAATTAS